MERINKFEASLEQGLFLLVQDVLQSSFEKKCKIHRKTPFLKYFSNKALGP